MRFGNITATAFVSYNRMDAILNEDGEITSFPNNGYHRTSAEQKRRFNQNIPIHKLICTDRNAFVSSKNYFVILCKLIIAHYFCFVY